MLNKKIGLLGPVETASFKSLLDPALNLNDCPKGLGGSPVNLLALELHRRGFDLTLYSLDPSVHDHVTLQGDRIKVHFGPFRKKRARDFFKREVNWLTQAVQKDNPDMLHAHWTYEYALAAQKTGLPCLVTGHDAPLNILKLNFIPYRLARTAMAFKAIFNSQNLSVVSPYVAAHLRKYFFFRRPIRVIPNGMPAHLFNHYEPGEPAQGNKTGNVVFATVLVGWSKIKNGKGAIEAFKLLRESIPNAKLIMFGSGHGKGEEAEVWAQSRNLESNIEFVGQVDYGYLLERLKNEIDVLVHPALEEAQPMALIEPMSMGIPIIGGKNSGGVPWTLDNGKAGVLVDIKNPMEIAQAMKKLAQEPEKRRETGESGYKAAQSRFHIGVVTDQYLTAYEEILKGTWA